MIKFVIAIIGIVIVFIMMPMVMSANRQFQTDEYTQTEIGVYTGGGDNDADVVLDYDLWNDEIVNVTSISSNETGDANASADSYVAATNTLTIDGLAASTNRTLSITYDYPALTDYTGLDELTRFGPTIIIIVLVGGALFGMLKMFRG